MAMPERALDDRSRHVEDTLRHEDRSRSGVEATWNESDPAAQRHLEVLEAIRAAARKVERGIVDEAIHDYEHLLAGHPGQPAIWFGLAEAWMEKGESVRAIPCFERAVSLRPAYAIYLYRLGEAQRAAGQLREAVGNFTKALRIDPNLSPSLLHMAVASFQLGDAEAGMHWLGRTWRAGCSQIWRGITAGAGAGMVVARCLALAPFTQRRRSSISHVSESLGHFDLRHGRVRRAEERFRAMLERDPEDPEALLGLGRALLKQRRTRESRICLGRATARRPGDPEILKDFGIACFQENDIEVAREAIVEALSLEPWCEEAQLTMGWIQLRLEHPETAIRHFKTSLGLNPASADAAFGVSRSFQFMGDFQSARTWLEKTREIDRCHAGSLLALMTGDKDSRTEDNLEAALAIVAKESASTSDRMHAHFVAGMIEDHLGNVDRAFEHYEAANSMKDVVCDIDALDAMADSMIRIFSKSFIEERLGCGTPSERPLFIVGMPRSGSTLVEQVLASHPHVKGAGELYHLPKHVEAFAGVRAGVAPYPDCLALLDRDSIDMIAEAYLEDLQAIDSESTRVTDKMLFNFWLLGLISIAFPNARIIHTMRDPMDCCTSIYLRNLTGTHIYAYSQRHLGRTYRIYQKLMAHWRTVLPTRMLEVQYEDMVRDPETNMRKVIEFSGLEWDDRCREFYKTKRAVSTSSYAQVRQPIYGSAVGRWKRYERHLEVLKSSLQD